MKKSDNQNDTICRQKVEIKKLKDELKKVEKEFKKKELKVPNKKVDSPNNTPREVSKVASNIDHDESNNNADKAQNDGTVDNISPNKVHESKLSENEPVFTPDPKQVISKTEATDNVLEMNVEEFGNLLNNIIEDYNLRKKAE